MKPLPTRRTHNDHIDQRAQYAHPHRRDHDGSQIFVSAMLMRNADANVLQGATDIDLAGIGRADSDNNERFNGTLRREVLSCEWLHNIKQAQVAINAWLKEYNHIRPHHALGMRPSVPETLLEKLKMSGTEIAG